MERTERSADVMARERVARRLGVLLEDRLKLLEDVHPLDEPDFLVLLHGRPHHTLEPLQLRCSAALGLSLGDVRPLRFVAALLRGDEALGEHVVLDVLLQLLQRPPAIEGLRLVLAAAVRPVLDGRVTRHAVRAAQVLLDGAVDVADDHVGVLAVLRGERVPSRFHRLAVASPRRLELDKGRLARSKDLGVKVRASELLGRRAHSEEREEELHRCASWKGR
mmetsp:Transcript_24314/g.81978  ORF Transcript_24314/g.81978 Transcript_24314/m.81978 type:complete len:221 (-) Transcript_24314:8-670(-)